MAQSTTSLQSRSSVHSSPSPHRPTGTDPSIETLISYLVAAKRSLASVHLLHRATAILTNSRATVEATAALTARTKYLRKSLVSQLEILRGIQFEIENGTQSIKSDIQAVLIELEETDKRLGENIDTLQATKIEDGFKDRVQQEFASGATAAKEYLHDFVDSKPVQELKANIQDAIDQTETAETTVDATIQRLESDLQTINEALQDNRSTTSLSLSSMLKPPNVAQTMKVLEMHAHEMAVSLESLVKHFDLCVTAIKHTEGAGAAVADTVDVQNMPEGVDVDVADALTVPAQPMTEGERMEMLGVLANDAAEVEDVVTELHDRCADMEAKLEQLLLWRQTNEQVYADATKAFQMLEDVGHRLMSQHIVDVSRLATRWTEEKMRIQDGMAAMSDLCDVYSHFLDAYDGLIVESARRRSVKKQMLRVVDEAHQRLEEMYEEDLQERQTFRNEQGDYLPSDIWTGLGSLPPRYAIRRIDQEHDDSIPELPRKTVEEAMRRLRSGGRAG